LKSNSFVLDRKGIFIELYDNLSNYLILSVINNGITRIAFNLHV